MLWRSFLIYGVDLLFANTAFLSKWNCNGRGLSFSSLPFITIHVLIVVMFVCQVLHEGKKWKEQWRQVSFLSYLFMSFSDLHAIIIHQVACPLFLFFSFGVLDLNYRARLVTSLFLNAIASLKFFPHHYLVSF